MAKAKQLKVKLVKSMIGRKKNHIASVRGLGIRRMHQEVVVIDTPENRGMINQVQYMVEVEEV
jgi:large subunit ribosomal protein L30